MKTLFAAAAFAMALVAISGSAAEAGRFACLGDYNKYCSAEERGSDAAKKCMVEHMDKLSDDCKAYVQEQEAEKAAEKAQQSAASGTDGQ